MIDVGNIILTVFLLILLAAFIAFMVWFSFDPCHLSHWGLNPNNFCSFCGEQLNPYCSCCQVFRNDSSSDFCYVCGNPLSWEVPGDA